MKPLKPTTGSRRKDAAKPAEQPRAQTQSVREDNLMSTLKANLNQRIKSDRERLARFKESLERDPAYAFEWSKDAFQAAANLKVTEQLMAWLTQTFEDEYTQPMPARQLTMAADHLRREVYRRARDVEHSTSPTSNYMSLCMMSAKATQLELVEGYLRRLEDPRHIYSWAV
jgi:hypothetical protein